MEHPDSHIQTKSRFEPKSATAVKPLEHAGLGDAPTNEQREVHRVETKNFANSKEKFRDDKNTLLYIQALTLDSAILMLNPHDCVRNDGVSDGNRAWNLLKRRFRCEESPAVLVLGSQIPRMNFEPDEAHRESFIGAHELMTRLTDASKRISETIIMALIPGEIRGFRGAVLIHQPTSLSCAQDRQSSGTVANNANVIMSSKSCI